MNQGAYSHDIIDTIAFIGNHLPRKCGIATFTTDLCDAFTTEYKAVKSFVLAMNDTEEGYNYPSRVQLGVDQHDRDAYTLAANFVNVSGADMVSLQHEYGIFGGEGGAYILTLLEQLSMPVVTTLHTVLQHPDAVQRRVMKEIARLSSRLVVMSQRGADFLQSVYQIPKSKIDIILHGVPDMPFVDPNSYKTAVVLEEKKILLTSGFLSQNKGIEHVIRAMPAIVKEYPNTIYLILGTTHPHIKRQQGESYRNSLLDLARTLRVEHSVTFHNKFVDADELGAFMNAADIFITPYNGREQIVSGVLSYAMGAGKAIISTPYVYAQELLSNDRGVLVPFRDPPAISHAVLSLFKDERKWETLRGAAHLYGRQMIWQRTVQQYMGSFEQAREKSMVFEDKLVDEGGEG